MFDTDIDGCDTRLVIIVQPSVKSSSQSPRRPAGLCIQTFTPFERPGIPESLRNYKW